MTFREVFAEVLRKQGVPEEEIRRRMERADKMTLESVGPTALKTVNEELEFKPGKTPQEMIESLQELFQQLQEMSPEEQLSGITELTRRIASKNQKN